MLSAKISEKSIGKMKFMRLLVVLLVPMVGLIMDSAAPQAWAFGFGEICEDGLDESQVFIEWNSTDDDYGIQFFWDGQPWKWMIVKNERGRAVLDVFTQRNVKAQGLTEGFFESAEPTTEELSLEEFLERFPEGTYSFKGRALEGCLLVGEAEFTHNLLEPVVIDVSEFPEITWTGDGEVTKVEIVVELVVMVGDEESVYKEIATFPGGTEEYIVSPKFVRLIERAQAADAVEELKVEVVVDEESGNRTITELAVELED
jgi:hypothetical protein